MTPETILAEIDKDITSEPYLPRYIKLQYEPPELDGACLPIVCLEDPESVHRAKLQIAITVGFIRREGVEAYRKQTSLT